MISLKHRSYQPELLDAENIPAKDLFQNLKEIAFVNKYLGGNQVTINGLKSLLKDRNKTYHIIDIGCGAGDNLKALHKWCVRNKYKVCLYGLDIKKEAIDFAKSNTHGINITYVVDSYENLEHLPYPIDIAICCLFCHHFKNDEIENLFNLLYKRCNVGFMINDLHRHWLAYHFIKWMGRLFSRSYLFKNDAPLSVARSFKKKEIELLTKQYYTSSITWKWAFRWLVLVKKQEA